MRPIRRAIHLDFHTMPGITDFNREWDPEVFAQTLADAKVCYINAFAKCNIGFCYYPTRIGTPYAGMKGDMFGDLLAACHRRDIGVSAYINVGLDHELLRQDIGLARVNAAGQVLYGDRTSYGFRQVCVVNPKARAYLIGLVKEVAAYDIDGFFADCMFATPCYCTHCLADRQQRGWSLTDPDVAARHAAQTWIEFSEECLPIIGPDRWRIFNNVAYHAGRRVHTHAEVECLPAVWSYDYFWPHALYNRTVLPQVLYMTGRFQASWGDFGGFKPQASLEHDYFDALCTGCGVMIGDHMHPARNLDPAIYRTVGKLNAWIEQLEPYLEHSRPLAEVAAVTDSPGWLSKSYWGLARMLGELRQSFEIIHVDHDFTPYRVLILPDELPGTPELAVRLAAFVRGGGKILATGTAGLNAARNDFLLPEHDLVFAGVDDSASVYFRCQPDQLPDVPPIDYSTYSQSGVLMHATADATVVAQRVGGYFEPHWDGFHGYDYLPPDQPSGHALAAIRPSLARISFGVFLAYYEKAALAHRALVKHCLDSLLPDPWIRCTDLPASSRVTAAAKSASTLLHVKTTYPEVRGATTAIEQHTVWPAGARVALRGRYTEARTCPDGQPVGLEQTSDGYTTLVLPEVNGYLLVELTCKVS